MVNFDKFNFYIKDANILIKLSGRHFNRSTFFILEIPLLDLEFFKILVFLTKFGKGQKLLHDGYSSEFRFSDE